MIAYRHDWTAPVFYLAYRGLCLPVGRQQEFYKSKQSDRSEVVSRNEPGFRSMLDRQDAEWMGGRSEILTP